jgi:hypothetical protein
MTGEFKMGGHDGRLYKGSAMRSHAGLLALAPDRATGSDMQRLEAGDPVEQMVMPSRHCRHPPLRRLM